EHVVLEDAHREPGHLVADEAEVTPQLRRFLRVHPGRRLVEQEQPGPGGERAADLDAPPVDLRELAYPLEAAPRQVAVEEGEQVRRALDGRAHLADEPAAAEHGVAESRAAACVHAEAYG